MILITAGVTGTVTSVTMIGPLLVDISRDLGISLGQAGLLAAAAQGVLAATLALPRLRRAGPSALLDPPARSG
jgi:predicted MFS family arabinose efflux permease